MHDIIRQLEEKRELARLGGGQKRIDSQHKKGKLSAVNALNCCLIRILLKNGICSRSIAVPISVWIRPRKFPVTVS